MADHSQTSDDGRDALLSYNESHGQQNFRSAELRQSDITLTLPAEDKSYEGHGLRGWSQYPHGDSPSSQSMEPAPQTTDCTGAAVGPDKRENETT